MEKKKKKRLQRIYFRTLGITLAIGAALLGVAYGGYHYLLGGLNRTELDESKLAADESLSILGENAIKNIAFFGVDSRDHDYIGRSDAILVASVNGNTGQIKLISIARDTYVAIAGHGKTRINHAYAYGGAELAIQTINENFGLDITDYVTVNFDSLAEIIDAFGGIELEISEAEREQINAYLLSGEPLRQSGLVQLNGPQAVSYSRIRKIDSDTMRAARQRKVLSCLFEKALELNPISYPSYVRKFAPMVETSLGNDEILQLASAVMKGGGLTLEQAGFPNEYIPYEGKTVDGAWYYVYDLGQARDMLRQYLYQNVPFAHYGKTAAEIAEMDAAEETEME